MKHTAGQRRSRSGEREAFEPEGFALWCRIEEISILCGYDPAAQGGLLRELPDAYSAPAGQDPEEIAEEHPMRALAAFIRRFVAEYPETADALLPAAAGGVCAVRQPEQAA